VRNKTRQSSNVGSTSGRESGTLADVVVGGGGVSIGEAEAHREEVDLLIQTDHLYGAPPIRSVNRHHHLQLIIVVDCRLPVVGQPTIHCRKSHREYPSSDADWHPERPELPSSRDHTATKIFKYFTSALLFSRVSVCSSSSCSRRVRAVVGVGAQPELGLLLWVSSN